MSPRERWEAMSAQLRAARDAIGLQTTPDVTFAGHCASCRFDLATVVLDPVPSLSVDQLERFGFTLDGYFGCFVVAYAPLSYRRTYCEQSHQPAAIEAQ